MMLRSRDGVYSTVQPPITRSSLLITFRSRALGASKKALMPEMGIPEGINWRRRATKSNARSDHVDLQFCRRGSRRFNAVEAHEDSIKKRNYMMEKWKVKWKGCTG